MLAICSDWHLWIHHHVLSALDPRLELAGLTATVLHGKAILLLLGRQPAGTTPADSQELRLPGRPHPHRPDSASVSTGNMIKYVDESLTRAELGEIGSDPLLAVHLRTPDRSGAVLAVIDSLRSVFENLCSPEELPRHAELLAQAGRWDVWFANIAGNDTRAIQLDDPA